MNVIAEQDFDLLFPPWKIRSRIYEPMLDSDGSTWSCQIDYCGPFDGPRKAHGASSLQAVELGVKLLSIVLYASDIYRRGELGFDGQFGGDLGVPAVKVFLHEAPYPF